MTSRTVHLGFEVGTGDHVEIPIRHMAVTGQTQESGKTTTLEALITRSGLPAIAFLTKRGETSFSGVRRILPFFKERADWQFVQSILESVMHQGQNFKQPWIMRACEGARSLADVQRRAAKLEAEAKHAMSQDMYMVLGAYLEKVVPLIASLPKTNAVDLRAGLSIMDLTDYPLELQMLVISSTLQWIYEHEKNVISIVPEAWEFMPQAKNTPVKLVAERLVRKGATLGNYLWIDSQDMAAVDKLFLRACAVWLIGVQREANEIKRALSSMPAGLKKPNAGNVATLDLGQFFACYGKEIRKTYVQPAWLNQKAASQIATGRLQVHDVHQPDTPKTQKAPVHAGTVAGESPLGSPATVPDSSQLRTSALEEEEAMPINTETLKLLRRAIEDGATDVALRLLNELSGSSGQRELPPVAIAPSPNGVEPSVLSDALYSSILNRLLQDLPQHPRVLQLMTSSPEIVVRVQKQSVDLDGSTLRGRLAILVAENFFENLASGHSAWQELEKRGIGSSKPNVYRELDKLTEMGFLLKLVGGFQSVPGMKVTKKNIEAAA